MKNSTQVITKRYRSKSLNQPAWHRLIEGLDAEKLIFMCVKTAV
jgi:hypothetical protein